MASSILAPLQSLIGDSSRAAAGYKLFVYQAGTTTKINTYPTAADADAGTNANTNPVILNSRGEPTSGGMWVPNSVSRLKLVLALPDDSDPPTSPIQVEDNIGPRDSGVRADLASTDAGKGGDLIGYKAAATDSQARTVDGRLNDLLSLDDFGATVDTAIARANTEGRPVFVAADKSAAGFLTVEAYGPGKVTVNGANTASNNAIGIASIAPRLSGLRPRKKSALLKLDATNYRGFLHLGGNTWQVCNFENSGADAAANTTPFGWNETVIENYEEIVIRGDSGVTLSGTWTNLTDTGGTDYVGHLAAQSATATNYVEIELTNTEDGGVIEVIFTGRTNGAYVEATIDGSGNLVNQLPTHSGYKFIDTYTAVDLSYKQRVLVATNLPAKSTAYTLRLTLKTDKNPSAGSGNRFLFNAVALSGANFGNPWSDLVRPKPWVSGRFYGAYEECIGGNGKVYVTVAGGTAGSTQPSGDANPTSDGAVDWVPLSQSAFVTDGNRAVVQAKGSQLEYAYEFAPTGESPTQDIGGTAHGNEYITNFRIMVDSLASSLEVGEYAIGDTVALIQNIYAYFGAVTSSPTHIADTVLTHSIGGGQVVVSHETAFQVDGYFGYYYPAMWPLIAYSVAGFVNALTEMETAQGGKVGVLDYAGQNNPFVGRTRDFQMRAMGDIYRPKGTSTVPSEGPGAYRCIATLTIDPDTVNKYAAGSIFASMATNTGSRTTNVGFNSWPTKMYFARANTTRPATISAGEVVRAVNEYHIGLFPK